MRAPVKWRTDNRTGERGLVLIGVLWVLLLLSLAALPVMMMGRESAEIARNTTLRSQARAIAEAGINLALVGFLNPQPGVEVPLDGSVRVSRFAGADVRVAIEDENGKIDINVADVDLLARLFRAAGVTVLDATAYAEAIVDWRGAVASTVADGFQDADALPQALRYSLERYPFASVEALYRVPGLPPGLIARIKGVLTVYSTRGVVDSQTALPLVRAALRIDAQGDWIEDDTTRVPPTIGSLTDMVGRAFTIRAMVRLLRGAVFVREAVIRLTGAPDKPYWIQTWHDAGDDFAEAAD
jgi:general secretion pathway protein K